MKFDELLKQSNATLPKAEKFVDDDPDKRYDNIVDAYYGFKHYWPKQVDGITFCADALKSEGIQTNGKPTTIEMYLNRSYKQWPNGDMTNNDFKKMTSIKLSNGGHLSLYELVQQKDKSLPVEIKTMDFVTQFNKLAQRVKK